MCDRHAQSGYGLVAALVATALMTTLVLGLLEALRFQFAAVKRIALKGDLEAIRATLLQRLDCEKTLTASPTLLSSKKTYTSVRDACRDKQTLNFLLQDKNGQNLTDGSLLIGQWAIKGKCSNGAATLEAARPLGLAGFQSDPLLKTPDSWKALFPQGADLLLCLDPSNIDCKGAPVRNYAKRLYRDALERTATDKEIQYWVDIYTANSPPKNRELVGQGFAQSNEFKGLVVERYYQLFLGHGASDSEKNFWVGKLNASPPFDYSAVLAKGIGGSGESFSHNGNNCQSFVTALYQGLLGRSPSIEEANVWIPTCAAGAGTAEVAQGIGASSEAANQLVVGLYNRYLGRPADGAGLNAWSSQLTGGTSYFTAVEGFLASQEYFSRCP